MCVRACVRSSTNANSQCQSCTLHMHPLCGRINLSLRGPQVYTVLALLAFFCSVHASTKNQVCILCGYFAGICVLGTYFSLIFCVSLTVLLYLRLTVSATVLLYAVSANKPCITFLCNSLWTFFAEQMSSKGVHRQYQPTDSRALLNAVNEHSGSIFDISQPILVHFVIEDLHVMRSVFLSFVKVDAVKPVIYLKAYIRSFLPPFCTFFVRFGQTVPKMSTGLHTSHGNRLN